MQNLKKNQVEGVAHQPFFLSEDWDEWSYMQYKNAGTSFFRFVTIHAFDRQTDKQTPFSWLNAALHALHAAQRGR